MPIFEEHAARIERDLTVDQWLTLSETEKALIIAKRRFSIQMQNLQSEAEIRKAKADARKK